MAKTRSQTLLEKAMTAKHVRKTMHVSEEELELIEAWLNGQISMSQLVAAADLSGFNSGYILVANGCKQMWQNGLKRK